MWTRRGVSRRRCLDCGFDGATLQQNGSRTVYECPSCGADLYARPARSYAELEGLRLTDLARCRMRRLISSLVWPVARVFGAARGVYVRRVVLRVGSSCRGGAMVLRTGRRGRGVVGRRGAETGAESGAQTASQLGRSAGGERGIGVTGIGPLSSPTPIGPTVHIRRHQQQYQQPHQHPQHRHRPPSAGGGGGGPGSGAGGGG